MSRSSRAILEVARFLPEVSLPLTVAVILTTVLQPALAVAFILGAGRLVDQVPALVARRASVWQITTPLAAVAVIFLVQQVLPQLWTVAVEALKRVMDDATQGRLMRATLAPGGGGHLEDPETRGMVDQVLGVTIDGYKPTAGMVVGALSQVAAQWLTRLSLFAVLGFFHWWIGLLLLFVVGGFEAHRVQDACRPPDGDTWQRRLFDHIRRIRYLSDMAALRGTAKEIRVFGLASWVLGRLDWQYRQFLDWRWRHHNRRPATLYLGLVAVGGALLVAVAAVGWSAAQGEVTLAQLAIYGQALVGLGAISLFHPVYELAHLAPRVSALRRLERTLRPPTPRPSLPKGVPRRELRLDGVTFRYPNSETPVLRGLDLVVPAGRSLAIVGENGAGKTTLVKVLCGLQEPEQGRVTVDGLDLTAHDQASWQRRVAAIFQDFVRYPLSARDNVGFGHLARTGDGPSVVEAARLAGAEDVVNSLPAAWDTPLSREVTGGVELSGGQWQRIALARALLAARGGATLLVLDEPAANLDVRAEAELNNVFLEVTRGLTTILISHRLSTVRNADRICVLEAGRVVEEGDHDSLIRKGGRYAELFDLQASMFWGRTA